MLLIPQNSTEVSLGHNIYIVVPKAAQLLVSLYYHTFKANYQPEICIGVTLLNPAISKEACYASCPMHTVHTWVSSFPSPPRIVAMGLHSRASFSIFGHTMISYTAWFWRRLPCSIDLVPYGKCLKKVQKFGEQSVWPQNFMDFVSMCMIHIVWWTTSSSTTTESTKTTLGNLWSRQCSNKSMWQEASRSWFYVIFECITKDCSKNKGLLTCTLFYVQPFQQTVLALLSLPFPHPFSDGLAF